MKSNHFFALHFFANYLYMIFTEKIISTGYDYDDYYRRSGQYYDRSYYDYYYYNQGYYDEMGYYHDPNASR